MARLLRYRRDSARRDGIIADKFEIARHGPILPLPPQTSAWKGIASGEAAAEDGAGHSQGAAAEQLRANLQKRKAKQDRGAPGKKKLGRRAARGESRKRIT